MTVRGGACVGMLAAVLCVAATSARASTIVTPTPVVTSNGDGSYTWAYTVWLQGDSTIQECSVFSTKVCDFFTIYDFAGYIAGSQTTSLGWTGSVNTGMDRPGGLCPAQPGFSVLCAAADDQTIPNLFWRRTGGDVLGPGADASMLLGVFTAQSIFNLPDNSVFFSQDGDNQTGTSHEGMVGGTNVPVGATPVPLTAMPEPASLLLLGSGLAVVARVRQRARRRA